MYNPKYDYAPVPRVTIDGKRYYATPDGEKLPSVTTILDATKSEESREALRQWRKNVGAARAQEITTDAANRGTRMHKYLELYIKNGKLPDPPTNPFAMPSYKMAQVVIEQGLSKVDEYWGIEVPLYYPGVYAGTTDSVGIHQGQPSILDFKQSNKEKRREWIEDYFLQTVFYATAHNQLYHTNISRGVIVMCVAPKEDTPPKYLEFVLEGAEWQHYEQKIWQRLEQYYTRIAAHK